MEESKRPVGIGRGDPKIILRAKMGAEMVTDKLRRVPMANGVGFDEEK